MWKFRRRSSVKKGRRKVLAVTALVIALDLQMQLGAKSRRAAGHHTILDLNDVGGCVVAQVTLGITLHDIVDLLEFVGKPLLAAELVLLQGQDQLLVVFHSVPEVILQLSSNRKKLNNSNMCDFELVLRQISSIN